MKHSDAVDRAVAEALAERGPRLRARKAKRKPNAAVLAKLKRKVDPARAFLSKKVPR